MSATLAARKDPVDINEWSRRAAQECSNQADPQMTFTDSIEGLDLPKRPSSTSTNPVCIEEVADEISSAIRLLPEGAYVDAARWSRAGAHVARDAQPSVPGPEALQVRPTGPLREVYSDTPSVLHVSGPHLR
jgi:hypothetical protein